MTMNKSDNSKQNKKVVFRDADTPDAEYNYTTEHIESVSPTHSVHVEKCMLFNKIRSGIAFFFEATTIHGVVYLAKRGLHIIER